MSSGVSLSGWRLYVIVDRASCEGRDLAWVARQAIRGGADVIQLRDKAASAQALITQARRLLEVTQPAKMPLLINDRVDVALAAGADGVHLGQEDLPVAAARRLLGPGRIIGKSSHSLTQALEADQEELDYLALGPVYPTPTKPDYPPVGLKLIGEVSARVRHPLVVIGGVDGTTLPEVVSAGAVCIAVVRAVCAAEDPEVAARTLKRLLTQTPRPIPSSRL